MSRTIFIVAGVFSAPSLLLMDSAVKGTALLMLAAVAAIILRRDSAATRHLVWLLAIVAMLVVPVLSAMLPQWRVLPEWASIPPAAAVVATSPPSIARPADGAFELPQNAEPVEIERPSATAYQPAAELPDSRPVLMTPEAIPASAVWSWNWLNALPLVWAIGFCVLILRLMAARWMLWKTERQGTVIGSSRRPAKATHDPIVTALEAASLQLGIGRPVTLLIHPDKTIPVIWGILRCHLLLPAAARHWSGEQLRSVLLHELAHIKRRDTMTQLLPQVACALHWFNPLVWFAAGRLGVERERACDDLVLASGVRPSAYAGHLLEVVTELSPARWTQSCGLAMARKSSLEGRLVAVLSENLNRRGVSAALAVIGLAIAACVAVPIAMLRAADENWRPPQAAHVGNNDFSTYCVHDGKNASFVIAFRGDFGSSSDHTSSSRSRTWHDAATLTLKTKTLKKEVTFRREHTAPDKLILAGKDYDLTKGRVFLVSDDGESIRQFAINPSAIQERADADALAKQIAAIPPQEREQATQKPKDGAKLQPGTEERLQWGKPVNGLRMAIVIRTAPGEPKAGDMPDLYLVVQNVSDAPIRLSDTTAAPQLRELYIKLDGETQLGIVDKEPTLADVMLQPREVAFLLMFLPDSKNPDRRTTGSIFAEGTLKDTHQTMVAELNIEQAPAGAWSGKLVTGETSGAVAAGQPQPKDKAAQALFKVWTAGARGNGKIPGALIGLLAESVTTFTKYNPTWKTTPQLLKMLPRLDATRDWSGQEAVALLDELAAVQDTPIKMAVEKEVERTMHTGAPLQPELADAPWGEALPNGLRMAWLLGPRAAEHRLGTPLKSRILFHNAGKNAVVFRALTWNQSGSHKARDAKGTEINISSTYWTTLPRVVAFRLAPGEYTEVAAASIGVGANKNNEDWQGTRVGSWIEAKEGDDVTFTPAPVSVNGKDDAGRLNLGESSWWLDFITDRLRRDMPLPADAPERGRILDRAIRELFGTAATPEETATFVSDPAPDALDSLAKRLAQRVGITPFTGSLQSGPTKFRVLPVDPDAAKKPRTANNPGRYTLGENARLVVSRRGVGERIVNEARIQFFTPDPKADAPGKPVALKLPDGYNTWAAAWVRGGTVLWVLQKGNVRSYDFTNPAQVKETTLEERANLEKVPKPILDALRAELDLPGAPKPATETPK
ncbi:MAG: M56 family metallopeptidase [Planctomycetaceae bacterium]